jgi:hypothetical protein
MVELPGFFIADLICKDSILIVRTNMGIYRTENMGLDWDQNYFDFVPFNFNIADDKFYLSSNKGIKVSDDFGLNWRSLSDNPLDTLMNIRAFEIYNNKIFCNEIKKGFIKSTDLGKTWHRPQNNNLPDTTTITSIVVYGENIFISSYESGIFYSSDEGENWKQINDGLLSIYIQKLLIKDDYIYAATAGAGVFKGKLSDFGVINSVDSHTETPNYLYAYPPYPLPATNEVRSLIYWDTSIDIESDEMTVYNIYGTKVAGKEKLRLDKLTSYSGNLVWDCSDVPSGIYLITIKHGTETRAVKVIVNK